MEALLGSIHFTGSLFEKPVNIELAKKNHQNFRKLMEERGIVVLTVRGNFLIYIKRYFSK